MKSARIINRVLGILFVTSFLIYCNERPEKVSQSIESVRNEVQPKLDSQLNAIALKNNLYRRIDFLIKMHELVNASQLLDSVTKLYGKEGQTFVYRGMIYQKSSNYDEALKQYNRALENEKFPFALAKRAELYLEKKEFDLALEDYRAAYKKNFDYSIELGKAFQLMKLKDSAIKYYSEYLEHYPNDSMVQKELVKLHAAPLTKH